MVYEKLVEMLSEQIDCDPSEVTMDTKFADLEIDSLDITELLMNVEDEFGIELKMDTSLEKISDLVARIEEKIQK